MATATDLPKGAPGPLLGTIWWTLTVAVAAYIAAGVDANAYHLLLGYRSLMALAGYLVMQIGLWAAENKWDEMGSKAYLDEAKKTNGKVSGGEFSVMCFGKQAVILLMFQQWLLRSWMKLTLVTKLSSLMLKRRRRFLCHGDFYLGGGFGDSVTSFPSTDPPKSIRLCSEWLPLLVRRNGL